MDDLYTFIGRRVRHFRTQKSWTQLKLAEEAGLSVSFLGHIERGTRKLSVETLYRLIQVLECSADDLLGTGMESKLNSSMLLSLIAERLRED